MWNFDLESGYKPGQLNVVSAGVRSGKSFFVGGGLTHNYETYKQAQVEGAKNELWSIHSEEAKKLYEPARVAAATTSARFFNHLIVWDFVSDEVRGPEKVWGQYNKFVNVFGFDNYDNNWNYQSHLDDHFYMTHHLYLNSTKLSSLKFNHNYNYALTALLTYSKAMFTEEDKTEFALRFAVQDH